MGKKYLYGASVQGIQGFIMKTNDLKPIVGASELVDQICTDMFDDFTKKAEGDTEDIVRAAGNIKVIFHAKEDCDNAFLNFPRKVMTAAPGITISQAVVIYEDDKDYGDKVDVLDKRLRAERNKPARPMFPGVIGMTRAPKTGEPAVCTWGDEYVDYATSRKLEVLNSGSGFKQDYSKLAKKAFGSKIPELILDNDRLAGDLGWLAVVHADGNGFGKIVQKLGKNKNLFKELSRNIDEYTQGAFQEAFKKICAAEDTSCPIRPLVLSGDDVTFICRADIAVPFVEAFLREFENLTRKNLAGSPMNMTGEDRELLNQGLTACAGIVFMKPSYPFYYASNLAESLCHAAKIDAKKVDPAPSCLMFYKIQDSIISDWKLMAARELNYAEGSFLFGPYYLEKPVKEVHKERWTIGELNEMVGVVTEKNNVKTSLRRWVSAAYENVHKADGIRERFGLLYPGEKESFVKMTVMTSEKRCPAYDILTMAVMSK